MILFSLYLLLTTFWAQARGDCEASYRTIVCNATRMTDVMTAFYESSLNIPVYNVYILDSSFHTIDYFPHFYVQDYNTTISVLAIRNSSVEQVKENAFNQLYALKTLDLSFNGLRNISFVRTLPRSLRILRLSNNNITHVDDVFVELTNVQELDLSYNHITVVNFNTVQVRSLNFSNNYITTLLPLTNSFGSGKYLDLSYNKLRDFDETKLQINFDHLNISNNQIIFVQLNRYMHSLKLSSYGESVIINKVPCSFNFFVQLLFSNSRFPVLNNSTLNIFFAIEDQCGLSTIDLSNSAITSISEYYFSSLAIVTLNLSQNNITILGMNTFFDSTVWYLDLSNSNITHIEKGAFSNAEIDHIDLSHNNLNNTSNICDDTHLQALDLSFNQITTIANYAFSDCSKVAQLNLSNCDIQRIELKGFTGLENIISLDLSHNKLFTLESNVLNNLPVKHLLLYGNRIDTIRNNAFNGLNNLQGLNISCTALRNLEPFAFVNLSIIETIDLSNNNLTHIPQQLFLNVPHLKEVYLNSNNMTTFKFFDYQLMLHTLHLTFNGIFKPSRVFNPYIKHLYIRDSHIDILQKGSFVGLYNLEELSFNNSYVRMEPGALDALFRLKYLDAQNLFRHDKIIRENTFSDLASLPLLNLSHLSLEVLDTKAFTGMKNLEILSLNNNNIRHLKDHVFLGLESLRILDLSSNHITSCDRRALKGLKNLIILRLENNRLMSINSQVYFGGLDNLLELHLNNNSIFEMHVRDFSELRSLQKLHLQNNAIETLSVGIFQYLPTLKFLNLSANNIDTLQAGVFSNLLSLKVLDLSNNRLLNMDISNFLYFKTLVVLRLEGNNLSYFDFTRFLANTRMLEYVGISHNRWFCDTLSYIIECLKNNSIDYKPAESVYNENNINGIRCGYSSSWT